MEDVERWREFYKSQLSKSKKNQFLAQFSEPRLQVHQDVDVRSSACVRQQQ
jgi:hypothetical protein